jgi:hypothetical protein
MNANALARLRIYAARPRVLNAPPKERRMKQNEKLYI